MFSDRPISWERFQGANLFGLLFACVLYCCVHRRRYTFQTTIFKPIKFANVEINLSTSLLLRVYCVRFLLSLFGMRKAYRKNRVQFKVSNYLRSRIPKQSKWLPGVRSTSSWALSRLGAGVPHLCLCSFRIRSRLSSVRVGTVSWPTLQTKVGMLAQGRGQQPSVAHQAVHPIRWPSSLAAF